jgi:hypothetical protein
MRIGPGVLIAIVDGQRVEIGRTIADAIVATDRNLREVQIGSINRAAGKITFDIDSTQLEEIVSTAIKAMPDVTVSYPYDKGTPRRQSKGERKRNKHNRWR